MRREEVARTRVDGEAEEDVALVGVAGAVGGEEEAVDAREEAEGGISGVADGGCDVLTSAEGGTEDGVRTGEGEVAAEESGGGMVEAAGKVGRRCECADGGGEGGDTGGAAGGVGEGGGEDGALAAGDDEATRNERRVVHPRRAGRRERGGGAGDDGGELSSDSGGAEDMDIIGIGEDDAAAAEDGGNGEEVGVEAEGEELRAKRTALARACARGDYEGWARVLADV